MTKIVEEIRIANINPEKCNEDGKRDLVFAILRDKKTEEELEILEDDDLIEEIDKFPVEKLNKILVDGGYTKEL